MGKENIQAILKEWQSLDMLSVRGLAIKERVYDQMGPIAMGALSARYELEIPCEAVMESLRVAFVQEFTEALQGIDKPMGAQ